MVVVVWLFSPVMVHDDRIRSNEQLGPSALGTSVENE